MGSRRVVHARCHQGQIKIVHVGHYKHFLNGEKTQNQICALNKSVSKNAIFITPLILSKYELLIKLSISNIYVQ